LNKSVTVNKAQADSTYLLFIYIVCRQRKSMIGDWRHHQSSDTSVLRVCHWRRNMPLAFSTRLLA